MAVPRIGIFGVHPAAMEAAADAFARIWPEAELHYALDEGLLHWIREAGVVKPGMVDLLGRHARCLVDAGADAVLFTCSAFHACIDEIAALLPVPVLGPNQVMIEAALAQASRLALLATVPATLTSLAAEIGTKAAARPDLAVLPHFVPGAFDALSSGNPAEHDRLVLRAAERIRDADAILLGQFTLARVLPVLRENVPASVFAAPEAAVVRLRARHGRA